MIKNLTGQKWTVFAFDATTGLPETGDAANITANLRLDGGAANAVDDTNPTELEDGYYIFDLTQAETNADHAIICPQSSTTGIVVIGVPGAVWTTPAKQAATLAAADVTGNLPANVAQWKGTTAPDNTGDAFARLGANGAGLSALPWNAAWDAEVQSECTDALNAYDPPTNTEMTARTLASASYATPTNITAGTITTVTNLTNAPTVGDFTTAMKTSLNNATPALSSTGVTAIATAVWNTATRSLTTFGGLVNDVRDAVWSATTRTLTAVSDSDGITTLLSRIGAALTFTSGNVHAHIKAKDNLDFGALEKTSLNAATPSVTVSDKTGFSLATAPPTATQVRQEMDNNSTKLANLNATITSRLAADNYIAPANDNITAIKAVTDKLDDTLELEDGVYKFTEASLIDAPTDSGSITVEDIAEGILDAKLSDHEEVGSVGAGIAAAGSAGDPWATELPGSYGNNTAGKIIGDNINATVASRLAAINYTAPPSASDIRTEIDANSTKLDAAISTRLAASAYEAPDNESIEDIKAKTDNLPSSPAAVGSEMVLTSAYDAAKTAASQSSVDTIDGNVDDIKLKTDALTFGKAEQVDVNVRSINYETITGTGRVGDEFGVD